MIIICQYCKIKLEVPDNAFDRKEPKIKCPKCGQQFIITKTDIYVPEFDKPDLIETVEVGPGWLIVHDELTAMQSFPLKIGKQVVGRESISRPCEIMIDTEDTTMSRNHFVIEVTQHPLTKAYSFALSDNNATNKTFINTRSLKLIKEGDIYMLQDGDIIQAGRTKIVFKSSTTAKTQNDATQIVLSQDFGQTVIIN